jgi:hypothetical protein
LAPPANSLELRQTYSIPVKGVDNQMGFHYILFFLLLVGLVIFTGCGEDTQEDEADTTESGDIQGRITDKETGQPIENATVDIGGNTALTDSEGRYILEELSFSSEMGVLVTAKDYREYKDNISLNQKLLLLDVGLEPIDSPSASILELLEAFSREIEALELDRIPIIQSFLTEDYTAAKDDLATAFGIAAGVIPPDYETLPETIENIVNKYDKLDFTFANPDIEITGDSAVVVMRFEVYAETKEPDSKRWEIIVDGRLELKKQEDEWKISYWKLVGDFLKFESEPL